MISQALQAVAGLSPSPVKGPRIDSVTPSSDQIQAAVDDLLGAPREQTQLNVKPARLSGIRELYHMLTGDYDLHGGFYPDRARFATTADFTGLVTNSPEQDRGQPVGRAGPRRVRLVAARSCRSSTSTR